MNKKIALSLLVFSLIGYLFYPGYSKVEWEIPSAYAQAPWPCWGHDSQRTGQSPYVGAQTNNLRWSFQTGAEIWSSPVIGDDGTIYIGSDDGKLYALNPDASLKWTFETSDYIRSSPAIGPHGTVYFESYDGQIYALNPDGSLKWTFETGDAYIRSSPAIGADGTIYIGGNGGQFYAFNPDGSLKWDYETSEGIASFPAIGSDGTVYFRFRCTGNFLYALNPDGRLKWTYNISSAHYSSPVIGRDGTIYIVGTDLYALNPDGSLKWTYEKGNRLDASPAIGADGTIYIGSRNGYIHVLNPDGSLKWDYETSGGIYSSTAIGADGIIYIGSNAGHIYAINHDGILKWDYGTFGQIHSSPGIGSDGTVYIGSCNGKLYAFGTPIEDIMPPKIICPYDMTILTTNDASKVYYSATVVDNIDPNPAITYAPESGSEFPRGATEVTATATDFSGNTAACTFTVTVEEGGIGGGLADSAWPCWKHDSQRTGQSPYVGVQTNTLKWSYQTGGERNTAPAIGTNGTIYIGSDDGYLYALNPDGSLKWRHQIGRCDYMDFSPAIGFDDTIYVGNNDGHLYAINPDGNLKWRYETGAGIAFSPAIGVDGTLYMGSDDGYFYALTSEGNLKWRYETGDEVGVPPATGYDGTIYVGNAGGYLYALNPDGGLEWTYEKKGECFLDLAIGLDNTIYCLSFNYFGSHIYALNPDGSLKWTSGFFEDWTFSIAIGVDGTVFVGSASGLYALNPDGSLKWQRAIEWSWLSAIGADGTIYVGGFYSGMYALNPDGNLAWSYEAGDGIGSALAIGADGTVYVNDKDGKLYAFGTTIEDTVPPEIRCPNNMPVLATGDLTRVYYTATAYDNIDPNPIILYVPESGSEFPMGTTEVTITATDSSGNTATCTFMVSISNSPPTLKTIGDQKVNEGDILEFIIKSTDEDNAHLFITAGPLVNNMSFKDNGEGCGQFTFCPDFRQSGLYYVNFTADDSYQVITEQIIIKVNDVNREPITDLIVSQRVHEVVIDSLQNVIDSVAGFDDSVFANKRVFNRRIRRKSIFIRKLNSIITNINQRYYQLALQQLSHAILNSTDGCMNELGVSDDNDWIKDCEAQQQIYPLILETIYLLKRSKNLRVNNLDRRVIKIRRQRW